MMWKKFQIPAEYLKKRVDDSSFKRWAQSVGEGEHKHSVYLRGFASDEGVVANLGRDGAAMGPEHFRKAFYKMPATVDLQIMDEGDFVEGSLSLTESHNWVRENGPKGRHSLNVSVGGGHDWAAVDFDFPGMQIIHIDTHLDVRPCNPETLHFGFAFSLSRE
ncbi:MAG: arginase family protein [Bdellovibrionota bacterium]